ncbi:sugar transferase [filamentous cyanobacterium LEGE 11480]|uniref:Sugar transferase n=1 Tax=Romeriopsis navalis LEGE 11480 TaxID=2777977 RepID=A0A928VNA3_9CYAN|nr:heterocyst development glycosyltransferase HepC [Romeriopsis navalis]MBE9029542.1 sugar transferase [Romeriopsis navalis LEGE 11480]
MHTGFQQLRDLQAEYESCGRYRLLWRGNNLIVRRATSATALYVRELDRAVACLRRSRVTRVKLGRDLGREELLFWADVCAAADCEVFLSLPGDANLPQKRKPLHWWLKCVVDRLVSLGILLLLTPVLVLLAVLLRQASSESLLVRQWQVGARGRLYRAFYFRTQTNAGEPLKMADWMRRYRLDRLPKFLNVLRGEMSIVGACPRRLSDVPSIEPEFRNRLNALPGITGAWMLESRLALKDYDFLDCLDVQYLLSWSLRRDFGYLLLTAPRLLADES